MIAFTPAVEQWREAVRIEAQDLPENLILGLIDRESKGIAGRVSGLTVGNGYTDAERACGLPAPLAYRALGLMQVTPIALRDYNNRNPHDRITPCDLAGVDLEAARKQIKAGASIYRICLIFAHRESAKRSPWPEGTISKEQILLADLVYTRGAGAVRKKLDECTKQGLPRTFSGIKKLSANWGAPEHPFTHALHVLAFYDPETEKKNGSLV